MNIWKISLKNLKSKPLYTFISIFILALSIALLLGVQQLKSSFKHQMENNLGDIDLVIGAKGSPLQLVLASVLHLDNPTGNISYKEAQKLSKNPMVKSAIPVSYGDNYKGYRIVGTSPQFLPMYGAKLQEGRTVQKSMEVVLGSTVAQKTNLKIGDTFESSHGLVENDIHVHEDKLTVVGILRPTQKVVDRLIVTNLQSVWDVHSHEGHDHDDEAHKKDEHHKDESHSHSDHKHEGHSHSHKEKKEDKHKEHHHKGDVHYHNGVPHSHSDDEHTKHSHDHKKETKHKEHNHGKDVHHHNGVPHSHSDEKHTKHSHDHKKEAKHKEHNHGKDVHHHNGVPHSHSDDEHTKHSHDHKKETKHKEHNHGKDVHHHNGVPHSHSDDKHTEHNHDHKKETKHKEHNHGKDVHHHNGVPHSHSEEKDTEHSHDHKDEHHHEHNHDDENKEITSLLLTFKNPTAVLTLPRKINKDTNMQAALPKFELEKLYEFTGIGFKTISWIAYLILVISGITIFISLYKMVKERAFDLALLRTYGADNLQLIKMVAYEALTIGVIAFIFGFLLAKVLVNFMFTFVSNGHQQNMLQKLQFQEAFQIGGLVFAMIVLAIALAIYPITKMNISTILSNEK